MWSRSRILPAVVLLAALSVAACDDDDDNGGGTTPPSDVLAVAPANPSGDGQAGPAGQALPEPLRVLVTLNGDPAEGETVTWSATGGGGSVDPATATTGADGVATTVWTLGPTAGPQTAEAAVAGADGSPVEFTATAAGAGELVIAKAAASGDAQTGPADAALPEPLQVVVTLDGALEAGQTVTWAVTQGGGSVDPASVATGADGIAATTWTLGASGAQEATATLDGAAGSPLTFTATIGAGTADHTIDVVNNEFDPAALTINAGESVAWVWAANAVTHTVSSTGATSFSDHDQIESAPFTFGPVTFTTPGTYEYVCLVHEAEGMTGTIIVQ